MLSSENWFCWIVQQMLFSMNNFISYNWLFESNIHPSFEVLKRSWLRSHLPHHHSSVSSSFICLIITHLSHHHSPASSSLICVIHLSYLSVSFICLIHLPHSSASAKLIKSALFRNDKNENEWLIAEELINMSIISSLLANHSTRRDFNLSLLFMLLSIVDGFCWDQWINE